MDPAPRARLNIRRLDIASVIAGAIAVVVLAASARPARALPNDVFGRALAALGHGRVATYSDPARPRFPEPTILFDRLRRVEARLIARAMPSGEPRARFGDFVEYYRDVNPELFRHFERLRASDGAPRGWSWLRVPAGSGKSFIRRRLAIPGEAELDVSGELTARGRSPDTPALTLKTPIGAWVVDRRYRALDWDSALDRLGSGATAWVIADIERLDADSAQALLGRVHARVCSGRAPHVVVLARPETLTGSIPPRCEDRSIGAWSFSLRDPEFRTAGDLVFRIEEFNAARPESERVVVQDALAMLDRFAWLRPSFGNLAQGQSLLRRIGSRAPEAWREEALKGTLFDQLLQKNRDLNDRPTAGAQQFPDYLGVLAAIAAHYSSRIDDDGWFAVSGADQVRRSSIGYPDLRLPRTEYPWGASVAKVSAVLDHSGLSRKEVRADKGFVHRFEPFWLHAWLSGKYERRLYFVDS